MQSFSFGQGGFPNFDYDRELKANFSIGWPPGNY